MPPFSTKGHDPGGSHRPFAKLAKLKQSVAKDSRSSDTPAPKQTTTTESDASDEQQFLQAMAGTNLLGPDEGRTGPAKPAPRATPTDDVDVLAELADLCDDHDAFDVGPDEHIEGIASGIDRRLLKRLRAGQFEVQAELDLHGMARDQAHKRVAAFVTQSRDAQRRCVLIIHGRGRHSDERVPVLKQHLRVWLQRGEIARSVMAFVTARPVDGGTGAVYILLRK